MKITKSLSLALILLLAFSLLSCFAPEKDIDALWVDALYTEDTTLGTGAKTLLVEVIAGETTVTFTLKTDKQTVGDALMEHYLLAGEEGAYGLYVKRVNGILADYDIDQSYWGFYKNGEMMLVGVDGQTFASGDHYELKYEK